MRQWMVDSGLSDMLWLVWCRARCCQLNGAESQCFDRETFSYEGKTINITFNEARIRIQETPNHNFVFMLRIISTPPIAYLFRRWNILVNSILHILEHLCFEFTILLPRSSPQHSIFGWNLLIGWKRSNRHIELVETLYVYKRRNGRETKLSYLGWLMKRILDIPCQIN